MVAKAFALPAGLDAMLVHLQLSILGKRAVVAAGGEVNALDLTRHITRTFQGQARAAALPAGLQRGVTPASGYHAAAATAPQPCRPALGRLGMPCEQAGRAQAKGTRGAQVFTETQGIVMEFEGTNFLLTCTAVTVADKMGDPAPSSLVRLACLAKLGSSGAVQYLGACVPTLPSGRLVCACWAPRRPCANLCPSQGMPEHVQALFVLHVWAALAAATSPVSCCQRPVPRAACRLRAHASRLQGRLTETTAFVFDAAPGSDVRIAGQRNVAAPQLFKVRLAAASSSSRLRAGCRAACSAKVHSFRLTGGLRGRRPSAGDSLAPGCLQHASLQAAC